MHGPTNVKSTDFIF